MLSYFLGTALILFGLLGPDEVFHDGFDGVTTVYISTDRPETPVWTIDSTNNNAAFVTSSTYSDAYFFIDPETWNASPASSGHELYETADLANSNILFTKNSGNTSLFINKNADNLNQVRVFPNPVMDDEISIQFNEIRPGNYSIQLVNALGKKVLQQKVTITGITQTELIHIPHYTAQGFYYIRILDERKNVVGSQKLAVERW